MRIRVRSLALVSGLRIWCCCELWCRLAAAARIQHIACELPYAMDAALKSQKKKKKPTKKQKKTPTNKKPQNKNNNENQEAIVVRLGKESKVTHRFLTLWGICAPNPSIAQGSTQFIYIIHYKCKYLPWLL